MTPFPTNKKDRALFAKFLGLHHDIDDFMANHRKLSYICGNGGPDVFKQGESIGEQLFRAVVALAGAGK